MKRNLKVAAMLLAIHFAYSFAEAQVNSPAPAGWRKIIAGQSFTFYLPPDMKRSEDVRGIDSYVEEYRGDNITIHFDYGWYSNPLSDRSGKRNFRRVETRIGGRRARIVTFYDPEREELKYFAGVHFRLGGITKLTMWAECRSPTEQDEAKRVFRSIRFPKARRA